MALAATRSEVSDILVSPAAEVAHPTPLIDDVDLTVDVSESELKVKIAKIARLPNTEQWKILDRKGKLFLIHYTDDANMQEMWWVRGLVVDVEAERVIGDSFGYTSYAVCPKLMYVEDKLTVEDVDGVAHTFHKDTAMIKVAYEGVVLRIFWYDSQLWMVTHRRLDTKGSRWGKSRLFLKMYEEAHGPLAEQLFDTSKPYSSTLYMFMVVDPELITATRQQVKVPYLVHIASMHMDLGRPTDDVATGVYVTPSIEKVPGMVNESFVHRPPTLTLEEANAHLDHGYYSPQPAATDERLTTGEALIIYRTGPNGHVEDVVKVYSPAFHHRFRLRGDNQNLPHQFHTLVDIAGHGKLNERSWYEFSRQLIVFPLYPVKDIKEMHKSLGAILTLPQDASVTMEKFTTREQRIHLLWLNFVLALPSTQQSEALELLEKFHQDKRELVAWLKEFEETHKDDKLLEATAEENQGILRDFLLAARKEAKSQLHSGRRSKKGMVLTYPNIIKLVIERHFERSRGARIYALVRTMKIAKGILSKPLKPTVVPVLRDQVDTTAASSASSSSDSQALIDKVFGIAKDAKKHSEDVLTQIFEHGKEIRKQQTAELLGKIFEAPLAPQEV